jgi:hypothetical protein
LQERIDTLLEDRVYKEVGTTLDNELKSYNYKLTDEEKNNLKNEIENDLYESNFQNNSKGNK